MGGQLSATLSPPFFLAERSWGSGPSTRSRSTPGLRTGLCPLRDRTPCTVQGRSPPTSKRQIQSVKWGKEDKTNCKAVPKKRLEGSPRGSGAAFWAGRPWAPSPPGDVFLAGVAGSQRVTDAQATPCVHPSSAQGTRLLSCQVQAAEGDPEAS